MVASLTSRIAVGVFACGLAFGSLAIAPASADYRHGGHGGHGGYHGGGHGHYAGGYHHYGYGYRSPVYGGPVYGGPVYYGPSGCIPVIGLLSGNYCNY
jgi:hypothetical protein